MIPLALVQSIQTANDVSLTAYGIDVELHLLTNANAIDFLDSYLDILRDGQFTIINTKTWIEWSPNVYKLKKLGLFNESDLPILAYFKSNLDIPMHSYIKIPITYAPQDRQQTDSFEIVNRVMGDGSGGKFSDIEVISCYSIAPLRNKKGPVGLS